MLGLKKQVARLEQTIMEKDLKGLVPLSETSIEKGPMEVEALIKKMAMLEQTLILMEQKMALMEEEKKTSETDTITKQPTKGCSFKERFNRMFLGDACTHLCFLIETQCIRCSYLGVVLPRCRS